MSHAFADFIKPYRQQIFCWGQFDCCLFVADWVTLCAGFDPAEALRGRYRTALGAKRALKRIGFSDFAAMADHAFGCRLPPLALNRGDIALIDNQGEAALGIVWGATIWALGTEGVVTVPLSCAHNGWRLPCRRS